MGKQLLLTRFRIPNELYKKNREIRRLSQNGFFYSSPKIGILIASPKAVGFLGTFNISVLPLELNIKGKMGSFCLLPYNPDFPQFKLSFELMIWPLDFFSNFSTILFYTFLQLPIFISSLNLAAWLILLDLKLRFRHKFLIFFISAPN